MASHDTPSKRSGSRKLQKPNPRLSRLPSSHMPARLSLGADAQDDVTAPSRGRNAPAQYMNQSIFSMIAAAGSRTDFNARFDESSDSEEEIAEEKSTELKGIATPVGPRLPDADAGQPVAIHDRDTAVDKKSKRLSGHRLVQSLPRLSARAFKSKGKEPAAPTSPSPESDESSESSSNPRDAPVLSRLITAEAEFKENEEALALTTSPQAQAPRARGDSTPQTLLATRLMEIFGFEQPEKVVAEYPCWLLQSVLLQGYLYITKQHICFYAYLPKKSHTVGKTGYLSKKGRTTSKFKRYWFSLNGDVLSYYSDPANLYFPSGNIDLRYGISAAFLTDKHKSKECKDFSLTIDHRTYHLRADTGLSAREWVQALQKTIFRSHNDGDSVKISLPVENIIDFEESPVVEFAETVKIRVIESEDSYAIDEYFFTFFSFGQDALQVLGSLLAEASGRRTSEDLLSPTRKDATLRGPRTRPAISRQSSDIAPGSPRAQSSPPLKDSVRATLLPFSSEEGGKLSPRMSGDFHRGNTPSRLSVESPHFYGRASFDRGRRSGSTSRLEVNTSRRQSPLTRPIESEDSYFQSTDKETDSSNAPLSPRAEAQMSASQILTRSDVFHPPAVQRMETLASLSPEPTRKSSEGPTIPSTSPPKEVTSPIPIREATETFGRSPREGRMGAHAEGMLRTGTSPTLQDLVKAGSYPLQRAGAFADFLKSRSVSMKKLLATESMSYLEKVSGMWAGDRKHYGDNEGVVPDDKGIDPEDEEANVGHGDRFRAHFALPPSERLQATYFGFLHRVLPLYGKIYISNRKFCFRSLLPGTRTKLVLPLKDIENVDKEKGFRFGYHGLVLVIRGHEELFFEFSSSEHRDDCTVTLLHSLETVRYMTESGILAKQDQDEAETAKEEHRLLQEARRDSSGDHQLVLPDTAEAVYSHQEHASVLFDDPRASIINFKPLASLRITCLTIGSRGDVQPYIALCKGLLAEGHKPRIATHAEFGPWVEKHGIEFRPVEGDPAELMRICVENGMFTYSFLREASAKFRSWIDELLTSAWQACQDSDLLIESPSAMAGIHIAEALKIPYFRAFTMPWTRTRAYPHAFAVPEHKIGGAYNYYSYVMFDNVFWKAISGQVNRWRKKELGLRSTNLDKMQPNKVPFLYNFSPHVVVPPLDYSDWVRVTGYWFLNEAQDWTPPPELTTFIQKARDDGKKLVYIGFGSIVVSDPAALTKTVVDSVVKAGVRCILSKGWSDRLGDPAALKTEVPLPADILQIKSAPHDWLFTQIDAAVHHGGAGTTGASLRAGVPTVIKPFFGDQFFFGSRVEDLGVGICLKKVNVSLFSRALWEATHSERMIVKARLLGEHIRQENGVQTAIQAIYRDFEYAKSLVKARAAIESVPANATAPVDEGDIEESWTFIGDESDPDLRKQIQEWDLPVRGRGPRVSMDRAGLRLMQGVEPVRKSSSVKRRY
ncbi:Sterol 3-beta-glucosyltransferase [Elasticomyces elasticus]|uniref:Sterol 3-beta-glucosyltransferase n=1 Tax=Exophiala sideris TaxID=1016849 RepID=A0ABR0JC51_9EURO|nr:Sterol 3-beta-glucosyltransferase [Elasticomyces elasticus]KAK5031286.1 Sterol 3-beta-glucosyltransferase [Exophiala sideris]KAK5039006.1 Sterol 3-beta-glucosyltransferase [Exophiala sideris]KAK5060891.1 Sterol 3-beta-glucosyltransferase [Exophiala sideris]KAK5183802.1 Sterol 3-beta-glucosyltransferase [Eurotiomycetes sp. CCFEE 6388]